MLHLDEVVPFDSNVFVVVLCLGLLCLFFHYCVLFFIDFFRYLCENYLFFCQSLALYQLCVIIEDDRINILEVDLGSRLGAGRLSLVLLALDDHSLLISHSSILVYLIIFLIVLNMKLISVYSGKIML